MSRSSIWVLSVVLIAAFCGFMAIPRIEPLTTEHVEGVEPDREEDDRPVAQRLAFGVCSTDKPSTVYEKFSGVVDYLAAQMSERSNKRVAIDLKIFKTYEEGRQALIRGDVEFGRFGPASYILIQDKCPNVRLLAMELKKGEKRCKGLIVARRLSGIKKLSDLVGRSFAFGDPSSTIGRYLAQVELLSAGVSAKDLSSFKFHGRHDLVFKAVELGDFNAGSLKESTFNKLNVANELHVIHEYWNVTKPWIAHPGVDEQTTSLLRDVLLQMKDKSVLKNLKATGLTVATPADYRSVREQMKNALQFEGK